MLNEEMWAITWRIYWKWALSSIVVTMFWVVMSNIFVGLLGLVFGFSMDDYPWVTQFLHLIVSLVVSFFVLNYFLATAVGKSINGKRLELLDEAAVKGETSHAH